MDNLIRPKRRNCIDPNAYEAREVLEVIKSNIKKWSRRKTYNFVEGDKTNATFANCSKGWREMFIQAGWEEKKPVRRRRRKNSI